MHVHGLSGRLMDQECQASHKDPGHRNAREAISQLLPLPSAA